MTWTIVIDDYFINVRATISTRAELEELIAKLTVRLATDFPDKEQHEHPRPNEPESVHPRNTLPAPGARAGCTGAHTQQKAQEDGFARSPGGD